MGFWEIVGGVLGEIGKNPQIHYFNGLRDGQEGNPRHMYNHHTVTDPEERRVLEGVERAYNQGYDDGRMERLSRRE